MNKVILEKVRQLRDVLADVDMEEEDREAVDALLRDIEKQALEE